MKTIILLSGARFNISILADIFWLKTIKRCGYQALYLTRNNTIAVNHADLSFVVDSWSDEFVRALIVKHSAVFLFHLSDSAGALVAELNEEFGLPGMTTAQYRYLHDKSVWPELLEQNDIGVAKTVLITESAQFDTPGWDSPIIVKATSSSSSISDKPYGYQFYHSLMDFKQYLLANDLMDDFLRINATSGSAYGRYLVQEKIAYKAYFFINLIVSEHKLVFAEVNEHKVYTDSMVHYESFGPVELPVEMMSHYKKMIALLLERLNAKNVHISFDIVMDEKGNVYTQDINSRLGIRWCASLACRKAEATGEMMLNALLGRQMETDINDLPPYLIKHIDLKPGIVADVQWQPLSDSMQTVVLGKKFLRPGVEIPHLKQRRFSLRVLSSSKNLTACRNNVDRVQQSINIEYAECKVSDLS